MIADTARPTKSSQLDDQPRQPVGTSAYAVGCDGTCSGRRRRASMSDSLSGGFAANSSVQPRTLTAVFVGGLIAGVLDLTYAILVYSPRKPIVIPQTIASGILGMGA